MRSRGLWAAAAFVALVLGFAVPANANVIFFTNRADWQSAAGSLSFFEDFSGFTVDTPFRTSPVTLDGMTIQQEGTDLGFRNEVDVTPLTYPDNNSTNSGSLYTNSAEGGDPGTQARITFNQTNLAFGLDSWQGDPLEGAVLEIFNGATLLGSQALTSGDGDFLGYVLAGGDTATSVRFRSSLLRPGTGGEGFLIDNLAGTGGLAPVPEPASLALLGLGMLSLLGCAWWQKRDGTREDLA